MGPRHTKEGRTSESDIDEETFFNELMTLQNKLEECCLNKNMGNPYSPGDTIKLAEFFRNNNVLIQKTIEKIISHKTTLENYKKEREELMNKIEAVSEELAKLKTSLLEDREAFISQTNFLNSIIADQQKKIYLLEKELGELEHLGQCYKKGKKVRKLSTPRMFCDSCEVFDSHETEDCPYSVHCKIQEEPFCDICEVYGHIASNCNDTETY